VAVRDTGSESRLARAIGVANIARLWYYHGPSLGDAALLQRIVERPRNPADAAREWFAALDAEACVAVIDWAIDDIFRLQEELDEVEPPTDALRWLHKRDDLASLAEALASSNVPRKKLEGLVRCLSFLDEHAEHHPALACQGPLNDERLLAVGTMDPDAWWVRAVL